MFCFFAFLPLHGPLQLYLFVCNVYLSGALLKRRAAHLGQAVGETGQVLVLPPLQAAPELVREELSRVSEVDHALFHPGELPRQHLMELRTVGGHLGARPEI